MRTIAPLTLALLLSSIGLDAQVHDPQAHAGHGQHGSEYAELLEREIKALSAEEIAGLQAGMGMQAALPAELNGWPGPRHVLDMGEMLALSDEQRTEIREIFDTMEAEAKRIGALIIEAERELDQYFASARPSSQGLAHLTQRIGTLRGRLRFAHLHAHLKTRPVLTQAQRDHYQMARGYTGG